jgi:arginine utilization regulatory protein
MNRRLTESEDKDGTASRGHYCFSDIMGKSGVLKESIRRARKASVTDVSILLFGETGTGKEMFAQSIHAASSRYNHPFVAINCAAIPENLIEGILFGTRKGVYTGASDRKGLFEEANNGTLFLDEINSMPLLLQGKLLRVLEEKKVLPLGAKKELPVNVRVISSCNQDPQSLLEKQLLRSDLFYRLAVVTVQIPPLRERPNDITKLVHHFVDRFNQKLGKEIRGVAPDCMGYLKNHTWPGNVRQLKHSIEGAMSVIPDGTATLSRSHLPEYLKNGENDFQPLLSTDLPSQGLSDLIKTMEREDIVAAMVRNKGNVTRTAKELGMSRGSLHYRIKKYGIR